MRQWLKILKRNLIERQALKKKKEITIPNHEQALFF